PADTSSSLQHQQDGNSQAKPVQETQRGRGGRVSGSHPAGAGLRGGVRVGSGGMKNGSRTWLTGHLRHHQKIYDSEVATYEQIPNHVDIMKYNSKIDLLEIFSGSARLTTTACRYGLNALQPFDLREGIDLSTPEGRELTLHAVRHHRPLLLHVAWPCKLWSLFNENMNWSHRLADLEVLREEERVLVKFTADLCKEQHAHGRLFLGENVLRSRLWQEPIIEDLARETDADFTLLDQLDRRFDNTRTRTFDLNKTDPVYEELCALVPWTIEKVWSKRDLAATQLQTTKYGGPAWHTVHRRVTTNLATGELIQDLENPFQQPDRLVHKKLRPPRDIETFFYHRPMLPGGHENPGAAEDGLAAEEADGFPSSTLEDGASGAAEDGPAAEEADGFPSNDRQTFVHEFEEQPEMDNWFLPKALFFLQRLYHQQDYDSLCQLEMRQHDRPFDTTVMFSHRWDIFDDNTMCLKFPGFDGSPDTIGFQRCQVYMNFYLKSAQRQQEVTEGDPEVSDVDSSDQDLDVSNQKVKTRQEQKQFEKEIPWRDIMKMDRMTIDKYILAIQKEFDGWQRWSGVQPIPEAEAERIFKDRVLRRRALKSRMAYRDKNRGVGTLAAKARCVLIGCADPDLTSLSRDSPTPSRTSEFLLLAILASGANGRFNNTPDRWHCWISDAKNAFLQGKQNTEERNGQPLYMQPPEDPLVKESGCFAAHLYLVTGNCYGLSNAPRIWYKHVCTVLSQNKFRMHDLDRCLFYHVSEATGEEKVDCVLIIHVDDVLAVYSDRFSLEILETMFEWGSVTKLDGTNEGTYRGKEIKLFEEAGEWKVKVTQKEFCKTLEPPRNLPGKMDDKLTPAGWKEFRSLAGCLQWLASQSRPPLAAVTSLSNKGSDTTFRDLKNLGEALLY
ncbi:unnamed protein product, partial [Durusdinium trenchii]